VCRDRGPLCCRPPNCGRHVPFCCATFAQGIAAPVFARRHFLKGGSGLMRRCSRRASGWIQPRSALAAVPLYRGPTFRPHRKSLARHGLGSSPGTGWAMPWWPATPASSILAREHPGLRDVLEKGALPGRQPTVDVRRCGLQAANLFFSARKTEGTPVGVSCFQRGSSRSWRFAHTFTLPAAGQPCQSGPAVAGHLCPGSLRTPNRV